MPTSNHRRLGRRGFTLVEVGVATFIVVVVALAGFAYYATARMTEINEWHEQNALFLAEREIESWRAPGYTGAVGYTSTDVGSTNFVPYGYRYASPDSSWIAAQRYKPVTLDGFNYRVRARILYNANTTNNYYVETTSGGLTYRYRSIQTVIQWGNFSGTGSDYALTQETRIAN